MSNFTEAAIESKVNEILRDTDLTSIPIDVYRIAKYYGFSLYQDKMAPNESGLIVVSDKPIKNFDTRKLIVVNEKDSLLRKRFTVAHELGHYFLNDCPDTCYAHRDAGDYGEEERDANRFASALLMPRAEVCRAVADLQSACPNCPVSLIIGEISRSFGVSESAAEVRLKRLEQI